MVLYSLGRYLLTSPSILELHNKIWITSTGFALSIIAWFVWNPLIAAAYPKEVATYFVREGFFHTFGNKLSWWAASIGAILAVLVLELGVASLRRIYFPTDMDLWQEIEHQGQDKVQRVIDEHTAAEQGQIQQQAEMPPREGDREGTIKSEAAPERPVTGRSFG